ncbi:MAG: PstS family phosphate ABC transporter substrate-binding protein [Herpetosiphon sp.]
MFRNLITWGSRTMLLAGIVLLTMASCSPTASTTMTYHVIGMPDSPRGATKPPGRQVVLKVSGAKSVLLTLRALKPAFEAATPGYRLDILSGPDTTTAVEATIKGVVDVAGMARPIKSDEAAQEMEYYQLGTAPIAVLAHAEVGVATLTGTQLTEIFAGTITNWAQVGGDDLPIVVFVLTEQALPTRSIREAVIGDRLFAKTATHIVTVQGDDMYSAVAGTKGSIGYGSWTVALLKKVGARPIALNGVVPEDRSYPVKTALGIGFLRYRQGDVQPLVDWLHSREAKVALQRLAVIGPDA